MKSTTQWIGFIMGVVVLFSVSSWAGPLSIPNDFNAGEPAVADQVNANFGAVKGAVDDNDSRITTNADSIAGKQNLVTASCPEGESIRSINADGTVLCEQHDTGGGGGGDITAVHAGTGLSGGGETGEVTIDADAAYLQRRVTGACPAGESIRTINDDGSVVCEKNDTQNDVMDTVAYAYVSTEGVIQSGSLNVSCNLLTSPDRYEITITDVENNPLDYNLMDFITLVTPIHNEPRMATVNGSGGKLIIYLFNADGNAVQSSFQFIIYEQS